MAQPQLYLFVGYPGAGKTTVAKLIRERTGAEHLWADQERMRMFGRPQHTPAENQQLYNFMNQTASDLLGQGKSVIFDTNFNFFKDREHLRQIAANHQADATVIWLATPKAVAKQRAVYDPKPGPTRLYGAMSETDFERIASHLEPPTKNEKIIKIDGTNLDEAELVRLLNL